LANDIPERAAGSVALQRFPSVEDGTYQSILIDRVIKDHLCALKLMDCSQKPVAQAKKSILLVV
jgi:hypothetical protein